VGKLRCQLMLDGPGLDLRVVRCEWREALSELFSAEVLFEVDDPELDLHALLLTPASVRLFDEQALARAFCGVIEQASYLGEYRHGVYHYRVRLLPQLHALAHRVRSRIFQNKDVKAIVADVVKGAGLPAEHFDWRTEHPTYPVREYCTQYKESELHFVQRLLAEEGIFYYFEHDELGHRMCLDDRAGAHLPIDPEVVYTDNSRAASRELVTELAFRTELVHDAYLMRDWDFMSPAKPVEAGQMDPGSLGLSHYEYPGGFTDPVDGGRHADDRLRAESVEKYLLTGCTNHLGFAPGKLFTLDGARPGFLNRGFLILECVHLYDERGAQATPAGNARADLAWSTRFRATHDDSIYRPRTLPKPKVYGVESGVITSAGEEIHVDEWGRVKVHLHWDRESPLDDNASCFLRVQQQNLSGSMLLPRLGWEVAVGFLDGDPDRPLVLQKLYNRETMPPYALPANLSQAALQSSSSPGGGGTNELRLQDAGGSQGFALHAQRDFVLGVGNDSSEKIAQKLDEVYGTTLDFNVGIDETISIGGNQKVTVKVNEALATGGDKTVTIGAIEELGVESTYTTNVNGNRSETIAATQNVRAVSMAESFLANHKQSVGAAMALTAAEAVSEAIAGNKQLTIGGAYVITTTGSFGESSGAAKLLTAGATSYTSKSGGLALKAKAALAIKVGGALVEKITGNFAVSGKKVTVEASESAEIDGGGTKLTLKDGKLALDGSKFGAKAGPMLTLKGKISYR
jgi:type VI secretion system secreted protein VgrG